MIVFENGTFQVDAETVAAGLGLPPEEVIAGLRNGTITSASERGIDADAGRHRLTFYGPRRRLRLIVDDSGTILKRTAVDYRGPVFGLAEGRRR